MDLLPIHYAQLLGLETPWRVDRVALDLENNQLDIYVDYHSKSGCCPDCRAESPIYDCSPQRSWRHLDTMQFKTLLHCNPPRTRCGKHGVKTMTQPWARKSSGFTLLFEAFAVKVLEASKSTENARKLLGVNWHQLQKIMSQAVERGLARRDSDEVTWIGMDEKSFRKGHNYISVINDLDGRRVLDVVEGREGSAAKDLITKALDEKQREMVCGVCIDMSAPYIKAIRENLPAADIVHDKFHISQHLGEAVDKTRRREHAKLKKEGDNILTNTKYHWLKGMDNLSDEALAEIKCIGRRELEVSKAWYLKELFTHFWKRRDKDYALRYFEYWCKEVSEANIPEMCKVARMLKRHLKNILTYFDCYLTNAFSEGINSKIQSLKASARGFRNFENYRIRILFFCGKLHLSP